MTNLLNKFKGCLLAAAYGDVLGSKYEWMSFRDLGKMFSTPSAVISATNIDKDAFYTDDTQMTICVAESLLADGGICSDRLAQLFVQSYEPWRGYGTGTRLVMNAIGEGVPIAEASKIAFTEGSFGNGAAMRIAPIALFYRNNVELLNNSVTLASVITHSHPHGIEGANILAAAIHYMINAETFNAEQYWESISGAVESPEFEAKIKIARQATGLDDLIVMGSDISALDSVPTALACAALNKDDIITALGTAILIGGDTDTVAAMVGSLLGALIGDSQIPVEFIAALDRDNTKGGTYLIQLAKELFDCVQES